MGIALSDTEPSGRSKLVSAAFTALGLVFFFGVGLAGGAAYKIYFAADNGSHADALRAPAPVAAAPAQELALNGPAVTEPSAPDPAPLASAAPALAPPAATLDQTTAPAAVVADATAPAAAASAPAPDAAEPAAQAVSAEPQPIAEAEMAPMQPAAQAATPPAEPPPVAATAQEPQKPSLTAKTHRATAPIAATHSKAAPPAAAGGFRVQFGAFSQEENARHLQAAIAATGLKVEVTHDQGASGHPLYFVRSPPYADRAAALSAAQSAQSRAQHLPNAVALSYTIIGDHAAPAQQAQR